MKHWTPDQEAQLQRMMQQKEQAAALLRNEASDVAREMIASHGYSENGMSGIAAPHLPAAILTHADALLAVLAPHQVTALAKSDKKHKLPPGVSKKGAKYYMQAQINLQRKHIGPFDTPEEAHAEYLRLRAQHPKLSVARMRDRHAAKRLQAA